jgi:Trypsin-like peptidase domain
MKIPVLIILAATLARAQSVPPRKDIPTIAKAANGAVVSIIMSDKDGQPIAQGSGFVVSKDGRIVTNYHVIKSGSSAIVKLPDGAFFAVDGVLAFDKERDIAIIKAHGENFRTVTLGESGRVQVGDEVVAIGNPLSLESTVSNGIVSAVRTIEEAGGNLLQITAPISPGSSGGPLFNMAGEVIGITTYGIKGGENLNFAIPVNDAKHLLLTRFSKIQGLPNEAEGVKRQKHDGDATPSGNLGARDYYQQLYDAGGFSSSIATTSHGEPEISTVPSATHVCFEDDAGAVDFFTFFAMGYDEAYAKASAKSKEIVLQKDWKQNPDKVREFIEAVNTYEVIQKRSPYVGLLPDEVMNVLGAETPELEKYLRQGGRLLEMHLYSKGVRTATLQFHWNGNKGFWEALPQGTLSIEPATLRYEEHLYLPGFTIPVTYHGSCEKIAGKP